MMHDNRRNTFLAIIVLALIWCTIPALRRQAITGYTETEVVVHPGDQEVKHDGGIYKQPDHLQQQEQQQQQQQQEQSQQQEKHTTLESDLLVEGKEKATLLMLARNSDIENAVASIERLEARFNNKFHYPWTFLNDADFTEEFKERTSNAASGKTEYARIPMEHWSEPSGIDQQLAYNNSIKMSMANIPYAMSESYRHMCRFNSGFFYHQEILAKYDWYWRVEPDVEFFCDIDYDPFTLMRTQKKIYGFVIAITDLPLTIETLWSTSRDFFNKNPNLVAPNNSLNFILNGNKDGDYNMCHFWSNFEIASLKWFRDSAYTKYFEHLDAAGGFFQERWGDAPVHSIAASVMLDKDQLHKFDDIGYKHAPYWHCPTNPPPGKCSCPVEQPGEAMPDKWPGLTCLPNWLNNMNKPAQVW